MRVDISNTRNKPAIIKNLIFVCWFWAKQFLKNNRAQIQTYINIANTMYAKVFGSNLVNIAKIWIWATRLVHNKMFKERTQINLLIVWQRGSFWFLPSFWGMKFLVKTMIMTTAPLLSENAWFKVVCRTPKFFQLIMYHCNQRHFI